jgi:hypothetical protein
MAKYITNLYDPVLYPREKCAEGYRAVDRSEKEKKKKRKRKKRK